jgi:hypothetical protein
MAQNSKLSKKLVLWLLKPFGVKRCVRERKSLMMESVFPSKMEINNTLEKVTHFTRVLECHTSK